MISLRGVSKTYDHGKTFAVRDVHLDVHPGEFLILLGESGCGKTSTLKMINRLIEPTAGTILIEDVDTGKADPVELRRRIGYAFQGIGLFPHMTVAENIAIVPRLLRWNPHDIDSRIDELLTMVGLEPGEYAHRKPAELSGGQQQRVGLARALAARPRIMLMDEPFGALDPITRDSLQKEVKNLQRSLKLTVVMVTHDMMEALLLADRIAVMERGQVIALESPHQLLSNPGHPYAAALMETPKRQAERLESIARHRSPP